MVFINKAIYWISTGILSAMMVFSTVKYIVNTEQISNVFSRIGYSEKLVLPLAILKSLGVLAIVSKKSFLLKELAYLGFLIAFILAFEGHWSKNDGGHTTVLVALTALIISYLFDKIIFKRAPNE